MKRVVIDRRIQNPPKYGRFFFFKQWLLKKKRKHGLIWIYTSLGF